MQVLKERVDIIHEDYVKKWRETALNERVEFYAQNELHKIFETFPNLCNPAGSILVRKVLSSQYKFFMTSYELCNWHININNTFSFQVHADFHTFFKKSDDLFSKKWPTIAKKIIQLAQSKKKDVEIKTILKNNTPFNGEGTYILYYKKMLIEIRSCYKLFCN